MIDPRVDSRRKAKQRGIVIASAGYVLAVAVLLSLHLGGDAVVSTSHWLLIIIATLSCQALLWLIVHRGWDAYLPWDQHFVIVPMAVAAGLLNLYAYVSPLSSTMLLMTWFIVLLFAAGLIGAAGVLTTSAAMGVGRIIVDVMLNRQGRLVTPAEVTVLVTYFIVSIYVSIVFERLRREREERKVLSRERAKAVERAQASETRYRTLFEDVPVGIYRTTPDGQCLDANPALVQMLGYPDLDSLQRADVTSFYADPEDRRRWQELMARHGIVSAHEARARRVDGTIFWVRDSARTVYGPDGRILFYEGTWEDITDTIKLRESLRFQAIRDPLTGLFNRRYLEETLDRELHRVIRKGAPLGIIMIDLDHFKQFNDCFGHEAGDVLLRELGRLLQNNIRAEDIPCRYGGEEFTLILPEAPLEVTRRRADHLRECVKQLLVLHRDQPLGSISLSCGVAAYPEHGDTAEALLRVADAALYRAKAEGRDRVVVANFQPA